MKTINKKVQQKGFTFVELLIIMIVVAILSGIGIQFVLTVQEDKARLTNAKAFLIKDVPAAIYSCILRREKIEECKVDKLHVENIDEETEWGDDRWVVAGFVKNRGATESISICYPLRNAGTQAKEVGEGLRTYLNNQFAPANSQAAYYDKKGDHGLVGSTTSTLDDFVGNISGNAFTTGSTNTAHDGDVNPHCDENRVVVVKYVTRL